MNSETDMLKSADNLAAAIGAVGRAYIFIYLNINLGTLDILPDWAGYLFIIGALSTLSLWEESTMLLRNLGFLLAIYESAEWILKLMGGQADIPVMGLLAGIVGLYFHFQLLTNMASIASQYGLTARKENILKLRTANTVLQTVAMLTLQLSSRFNDAWLALVMAVIIVILTIMITVSIYGLKKELVSMSLGLNENDKYPCK